MVAGTQFRSGQVGPPALDLDGPVEQDDAGDDENAPDTPRERVSFSWVQRGKPMPNDDVEGVSGKAETFRVEIREGDVTLALEVRGLGQLPEDTKAGIRDALLDRAYVPLLEALQDRLHVIVHVPIATPP